MSKEAGAANTQPVGIDRITEFKTWLRNEGRTAIEMLLFNQSSVDILVRDSGGAEERYVLTGAGLLVLSKAGYNIASENELFAALDDPKKIQILGTTREDVLVALRARLVHMAEIIIGWSTHVGAGDATKEMSTSRQKAANYLEYERSGEDPNYFDFVGIAKDAHRIYMDGMSLRAEATHRTFSENHKGFFERVRLMLTKKRRQAHWSDCVACRAMLENISESEATFADFAAKLPVNSLAFRDDRCQELDKLRGEKSWSSLVALRAHLGTCTYCNKVVAEGLRQTKVFLAGELPVY
jgi:hypothetical protein